MATQMQARCTSTNREVLAALSTVVIDDAADTYRWSCPSCGGRTDERSLSDDIRDVLRAAGVPTVEELVESAAVELQDDHAIWRALLSP